MAAGGWSLHIPSAAAFQSRCEKIGTPDRRLKAIQLNPHSRKRTALLTAAFSDPVWTHLPGRFSKHGATRDVDEEATVRGISWPRSNFNFWCASWRPRWDVVMAFSRFSRPVHNAEAFSTLCARRVRRLASSLLNLSTNSVVTRGLGHFCRKRFRFFFCF